MISRRNFKTTFVLSLKNLDIPLRIRKAGRVLCGGARETHRAACHNEVTVSKTEQSLRSRCFSKSLLEIMIFFILPSLKKFMHI